MTTTMRAVRLHEVNGRAEFRLDTDVEVPSPTAGEVLLAVKACGLNQVDLLTRDGQTPAAIPLPHISGTEQIKKKRFDLSRDRHAAADFPMTSHRIRMVDSFEELINEVLRSSEPQLAPGR